MNFLKRGRREKSILAVMLVVCFFFNTIAAASAQSVYAQSIDFSNEGGGNS